MYIYIPFIYIHYTYMASNVMRLKASDRLTYKVVYRDPFCS